MILAGNQLGHGLSRTQIDKGERVAHVIWSRATLVGFLAEPELAVAVVAAWKQEANQLTQLQ